MRKKGQGLLSDEYLCAVGDVIVSFNYLEASVVRIFEVLLAPTIAGRIMATKIGFRQLREFTLAVYQSIYGEDEDYQAFRSLCAEMEGIEEERNRMAHCTWTSKRYDAVTAQSVNIGTQQTKIATNRSIRYDFRDISVGELEALADRIRNLTGRVSKFDLSHYDRKKYRFVRYEGQT
jgi:hypothetical protein